MKRLLFICYACICSISCFSQEQFSMEKYLATSLSDQSLGSYQNQLKFLESNNYNAPWLNRVEFRIGSEDANASLNEYRVRLSPTNPAEIKANKGYHQLHQQSILAQQEVVLNAALKKRYLLLIQFDQLAGQKLSLDSLVSFKEKLIEGLTIGNYGLQTKDLVTIQSEQTELLIKQSAINHELENVMFYIKADIESDLNSKPIDGIISIQRIRNYVSNAIVQNTKNAALHAAENELNLDRQKLAIEKAEARSNIGYIQSNIDTERGDETSEHVGFQVGVRIPIVNPDKPKLNREKVKLLESEQELLEQQRLIDQLRDFNEIRLQQLFDRYQLLERRIELAKHIPAPNTYQQLDWKAIFDTKKYRYELLEMRLDLESEIRELFVTYLDIRGLLTNKPLINYLSDQFEPIVPDN